MEMELEDHDLLPPSLEICTDEKPESPTNQEDIDSLQPQTLTQEVHLPQPSPPAPTIEGPLEQKDAIDDSKDDAANSTVETTDQECEGSGVSGAEESGDESVGGEQGIGRNFTNTGKTVTLHTLLKVGLLEPGPKALSIDYLGTTFTGDLLQNGKIRWLETNQLFNSPSAWAIHCKKIVNPEKKSGCGWASIKYKGKKLDWYKTEWHKRKKTETSPTSTTTTDQPKPQTVSLPIAASTAIITPITGRAFPVIATNTSVLPPSLPGVKIAPGTSGYGTVLPSARKNLNYCSSLSFDASKLDPMLLMKDIEELLPAPTAVVANPTTPLPGVVPGAVPEVNRRPCVKHSQLGNRTNDHDPSLMVEYSTFGNLGKMQPFIISMSTNCLLIMDFHSHLTKGEVCGYLGGHWDVNLHNLAIQEAFPLKCQSDSKEACIAAENEIRATMDKRQLNLVGWYHTHPSTSAQPTLRDIDCQLEYQICMRGETDASYTPCIGVICAPYNVGSAVYETSILGYWVLPPPENRPLEYGKPMMMTYSIVQDNTISQAAVNEITSLVAHYRGTPGWICFNDKWLGGITYLEKLLKSLKNKEPKDQTKMNIQRLIRELLFAPLPDSINTDTLDLSFRMSSLVAVSEG